MKALPNFFIVGAPKAGTTSLYHYLLQHPQIYMSPIKEPNYFAPEVRPANAGPAFQKRVSRDICELQEYLRRPVLSQRFGGIVSNWLDYLRLFEGAKGARAIGEASVFYLYSKMAARNIVARIPDSKILMILRNPADRAFAQYLHTVTNGLVRESFRTQIEIALRQSYEHFGILRPFLELGLYFEQVKRFLRFFPAANVRIYFFEDYQKQPLEMLVDIFRFLDVDPTFAPNLSQRHLEPRIPKLVTLAYFLKRYGIWQRAAALSPLALRSLFRMVAFRDRRSLAMGDEVRKWLIDYYRDDVGQLSDLLGCDLSAWLS